MTHRPSDLDHDHGRQNVWWDISPTALRCPVIYMTERKITNVIFVYIVTFGRHSFERHNIFWFAYIYIYCRLYIIY